MGLDVLNKGHNRTLGDILALFWAAKLYIIGFMLVLGGLSILWLMAQPNYYRATMLIGPVEPLFHRQIRRFMKRRTLIAPRRFIKCSAATAQ